MTDLLDDELQRVRADLRAAAAATTDAAAALADLRAGSHPTTPGTPRRNDRLAVVGAALLIAASLVAVAIVGGIRHRSTAPGTTRDTAVDRTTSSSPISSTTPNPAAAGTAVIASASHVWFDDPRIGFAVVHGGATTEVYGTADGGATWTPVGRVDDTSAPRQLSFADTSNGWLVTDAGVWATHDGGHTWRHANTSGLGDFGAGQGPLVAAGGTVYAMGRFSAPDGPFILAASPITSDDFSLTGVSFALGTGPVASFSIAAAGSRVWAIYNDRVFTGGARLDGDAIDLHWKPPAFDQGGSIEVVTARDGGPIYTFGLTGVWTDAIQANVVSVSDDGGMTFRAAHLPDQMEFGGQHNQIRIVPIDRHTVGAVVTTPDGLSTSLYTSTDEATTWTPVAAIPVTDVRFVDATTAIGTAPTGDGSSQAMRSNDGGRTWAPLGRPPIVGSTTPSSTVAPGSPYDIGAISFTNADLGWLLTSSQVDQRTTLLQTRDGGRHWVVAPTVGVPSDARMFGVAFADLQNGWLWGDGWWSTHDGGSTWHALPANASGVTPNRVIVTGGYAYALSADDKGVFGVMRSPVAIDDFVDTGLAWERGAGGNDVSLSLVSQGSSVFVAFNDRGGRTGRILGSRADPTWTPAGAGRGGNIDFATAPGGQDLYLATQTGIWGGDAVSQLIVEQSTDGGATFSPLPLPAELSVVDQLLRFCGLRAPEAGTVVVLGCDANRTVLIASADGGQSWRPTITLPADAFDVQLLTPQFVTYRTGGQPSALMVSSDGGVTWHQSFPPAP